jgi:hypothetical protein
MNSLKTKNITASLLGNKEKLGMPNLCLVMLLCAIVLNTAIKMQAPMFFSSFVVNP